MNLLLLYPWLICSFCILVYMPRANCNGIFTICQATADAIKEEISLYPSHAQSTTGVSQFVLLLHNCWLSGGYDNSQCNSFFSSHYYYSSFLFFVFFYLTCAPSNNMTWITQYCIFELFWTTVGLNNTSPSRLSNTYQLTCIHQGCLWSWYLIFYYY